MEVFGLFIYAKNLMERKISELSSKIEQLDVSRRKNEEEKDFMQNHLSDRNHLDTLNCVKSLYSVSSVSLFLFGVIFSSINLITCLVLTGAGVAFGITSAVFWVKAHELKREIAQNQYKNVSIEQLYDDIYQKNVKIAQSLDLEKSLNDDLNRCKNENKKIDMLSCEINHVMSDPFYMADSEEEYQKYIHQKENCSHFLDDYFQQLDPYSVLNDECSIKKGKIYTKRYLKK